MLALLTSAVALFLIDQGSKRLICARRDERILTLGQILQIRCVLNQNRMYRQPGVRITLALTWILAVVSATALYALGIRFQTASALFALGLAFGGSASNLFDILRDHQVVDFIDLGWWPVFNLADIAIVLGLAVAILR